MAEVDFFSAIDSDGSGTISREELERAITQRDVDKTVVQKLFDVFDQNGDGQISREEAYVKVFAKDPYDENLIKKFHELDDNGDGVLSYKEFCDGMAGKLTVEQIDDLFERLEKDGDGVISLDEFVLARVYLAQLDCQLVDETLERSKASLADLVKNINKGENMNACLQIFETVSKQQMQAKWLNKKRLYMKMPKSEFDTLIQNSFDKFDLSKSGSLIRHHVVDAIEFLGKKIDDKLLDDLYLQLGCEKNSCLDLISFSKLVYEVMLKGMRLKSRISQLAQPKLASLAEITVQEYLDSMIQEERSSKSSVNKKISSSRNVRKAVSGLKKNGKSIKASGEEAKDSFLVFEFERLDQNGDGELTSDELFEGLRHRLEQDELAELFDQMDKNGDGKITLEEFIEAGQTIAFLLSSIASLSILVSEDVYESNSLLPVASPTAQILAFSLGSPYHIDNRILAPACCLRQQKETETLNAAFTYRNVS
eukprot:767689-Hanusia_phi.AAC.1